MAKMLQLKDKLHNDKWGARIGLYQCECGETIQARIHDVRAGRKVYCTRHCPYRYLSHQKQNNKDNKRQCPRCKDFKLANHFYTKTAKIKGIMRTKYSSQCKKCIAITARESELRNAHKYKTVEQICEYTECSKKFMADRRSVKRGWGRFCTRNCYMYERNKTTKKRTNN